MSHYYPIVYDRAIDRGVISIGNIYIDYRGTKKINNVISTSFFCMPRDLQQRALDADRDSYRGVHTPYTILWYYDIIT